MQVIRLNVRFHYASGWQELWPVETTRSGEAVPPTYLATRRHNETTSSPQSLYRPLENNSFNPEDGSSMFLRNVSTYYTTQCQNTLRPQTELTVQSQPGRGHQTRLSQSEHWGALTMLIHDLLISSLQTKCNLNYI